MFVLDTHSKNGLGANTVIGVSTISTVLTLTTPYLNTVDMSEVYMIQFKKIGINFLTIKLRKVKFTGFVYIPKISRNKKLLT